MTFLELVQRYCVESGLGSGPSTVIGQTDDYLKAVNDINTAYKEIQGQHEDWLFLLKSFAFSSSDIVATTPTGMPAEISFQDTTVSTMPTDISAFREGKFSCFLTATGSSDEQQLIFLPWDRFRLTFYQGANRNNTGRPAYVSIKPSLELRFHPYFDADYTVVGEYYQEPQKMVYDTDVPVFKQHHEAIMWKALMLYGAAMSEPDKYAFGRAQYVPMLRKLEITQLPRMTFGRPLV